MILRRVIEHVREQNWTAIGIDFVIVVVGVFIGLQVNLWNEVRVESKRQERIIDALVTNLSDAIAVQERFINEIDTGLSEWEAAFARGEMPLPFVYRIEGSDYAPDLWATFQQMGVTDLFDPATLVDLTFFYSELDGVGRKYVRYVSVVEDEILPGLAQDADAFYRTDGQVQPRVRANMDRLREYRQELGRLSAWAECLVYRLEAKRTFEQNCLRADFRLDGMKEPARRASATATEVHHTSLTEGTQCRTARKSTASAAG